MDGILREPISPLAPGRFHSGFEQLEPDWNLSERSSRRPDGTGLGGHRPGIDGLARRGNGGSMGARSRRGLSS